MNELATDEAKRKALVDSGMLIEKEDRSQIVLDRSVFPIRNPRGQVIAFGGRVLGNEKPKYLNSPETHFS